MKSDSIEAYDLPERVRRYDADMDLMHPLRWKMIDVALEILPFDRASPLRAMDLGVGTGAFTQRFLERFADARVVAVDGAASMLDLARARLGDLAGRVDWAVADFGALPDQLVSPDSYDIVFSSYALHHLDAQRKAATLETVIAAIRPGGWFVNADILVADTPAMHALYQELRFAGIVERAAGADPRFETIAATRRYIAEMEARERDSPQTLGEDLRMLREAGLPDAEVFWKEYREAVTGGQRCAASE